jgi:hypothetical protein
MTTITIEATQQFQLMGEYWQVVFDGERAWVRDSKGMQQLARLLTEAGREIHAIDLAGGVAIPGGCGAALDERAKRSYRLRLRDLEQAVDAAVAAGDDEARARAEVEVEWLHRELAAAVGLGGCDRIQGAASERARQAVTKSLKAAIKRLAVHCPRLAQHLAATVHTGTYCSYLPDPRLTLAWAV